MAKEMLSARRKAFLHPFCGRLDKKDGVWREATRRFFLSLKKLRVTD
jgi:hypothetical protein